MTWQSTEGVPRASSYKDFRDLSIEFSRDGCSRALITALACRTLWNCILPLKCTSVFITSPSQIVYHGQREAAYDSQP